jgi:hypothetical protein
MHSGQPVTMEGSPLELSNVVRFELPAYADADAFCARIRPRWAGTRRLDGDVWRISARVRRSKNDLALLLREVEAYVAAAGLQAIRYELDGRWYIMDEPRQAVAS